jgi:putative endonuclease
MKTFFVYVLKSDADGKHYVGATQDLERRIALHNAGLYRYTKAHLPWRLVYSESCATRSEAMKRERYYKTGRGREDLKNLISA